MDGFGFRGVFLYILLPILSTIFNGCLIKGCGFSGSSSSSSSSYPPQQQQQQQPQQPPPPPPPPPTEPPLPTHIYNTTIHISESETQKFADYPLEPMPNILSIFRWVVTASSGRTIQMTIESNSLRTMSSCTVERYSVTTTVNSQTTRNNLCDYTDNNNFHGDRFEIRYVARTLSTTLGFRFRFDACGHNTTLSTTSSVIVINSPAHPSYYPNNARCFWRITAPAGVTTHRWLKVAISRFETFDTSDYLKIDDYDNIGGYLPSREYYGGRGYVDITFRTNAGDQRVGFNLTVQPSITGPPCGDFMVLPANASEGTILYPPAGPPPTPEPNECLWYIRSGGGNTFDIYLEEFTLRTGGYCAGVTVNGIYITSARQPVTDQYCTMTNYNRKYHVISGLIKYNRNNQFIQRTGFRFRYKMCGFTRQLTSYNETFFITSPRHDEPYPNNIDCTWTLIAPESSATHRWISLALTEKEVNTPDYLEIGDYPRVDGEFDETEENRWYSMDSSMQIKFVSYNGLPGIGFNLTVTAASLDQICGTNTFTLSSTTDSKTIVSPRFPMVHSSNLNCTWTVSAPSGSTTHRWLYVTADTFELEPDGDFLQVDNLTKTSGNITSRRIWHSRGTPVRIRLTSNDQVQMRGVNVTVTATDVAPVVCGGNLFLSEDENEGELAWPFTPPAHTTIAECSWIIKDSMNRTVELSLEAFGIKTLDKCDSTLLDVTKRSGSEETVTQLCSSSVTAVGWQDFGENFTVVFASWDSNLGNANFSFRYKSCGGIYNLTSEAPIVSMSSPNYPNNYPSNAYCQWTVLLTPPLETVNVTVTAMALGSDDILEIGNDTLTPVTGVMTTDFTNGVTVRFRADGIGSASGFNVIAASTQVLCSDLQCSHNCSMVNGNAQCGCPSRSGWTLAADNQTCNDVDECAGGNGGACSGFAVCVNTIGSFICNCTDGYRLSDDGQSCSDRDGGWTEWSEWSACSVSCKGGTRMSYRNCSNPTIQGAGRKCLLSDGNTRATHELRSGQCNKQRCPMCSDFNCTHNCTKINGWPTCFCPDTHGWRLDTDNQTCRDIDECAPDRPTVCRGSAECINTRGSFRCNCTNGYELSADGLSCTDRDGGWGEWTEWSSCSTTCGGGRRISSRNCDRPTAEGNGLECLKLDNTTRGSYENRSESCNEEKCPTCDDLECSHNCSMVNRLPKCSCPSEGKWRLKSDNQTCEDVDECAPESPRACYGRSQCINTIGSFSCKCLYGYKLSANKTHCVDRDGNWTSWGQWTACEESCTRKSRRTCAKPTQRGAGKLCLLLDGKSRANKEVRSEKCSGEQCSTAWYKNPAIMGGAGGGAGLLVVGGMVAAIVKRCAGAASVAPSSAGGISAEKIAPPFASEPQAPQLPQKQGFENMPQFRNPPIALSSSAA